VRRLVLALAGALSCASPTQPPGGPEDLEPPRIVSFSPDSGSTSVTPNVVTIRFDEIISETPKTGRDLADRIVISPNDGAVVVRWQRDRITVRPRRGWRENTAYVITLLPGISDLSQNARDSSRVLVFSTGASIPETRVTGVVFDWMKAVPAAQARILARPLTDTTLVYATESDSVGRFVLPYLATGEYAVLALIDANKNGVRDPRELWDSVTAVLGDSAQHDFYVFPQDTLPPRISTVTATDSLTLTITFDRPLSPQLDIPTAIRLYDVDSARVTLSGIETAASADSAKREREAAVRDSTARAQAAADTTPAARAARERARQDSINQAQAVADSIARDTTPRVPPPVSARAALQTTLVVTLSAPLTPLERYRIEATVLGANGVTGESDRVYVRPRPAAPPPKPDSSGGRDTTAAIDREVRTAAAVPPTR
jgi:hypothetical protein